MKTSELIKQLQENLKENGDLEIDMHSDEAEILDARLYTVEREQTGKDTAR